MALLGDGDVIAFAGKVLRGSRDRAEAGRTRMPDPEDGPGCQTRMMVRPVPGRLRLTLASVPAGRDGELEAALGVPGLIAPEGRVVTADALRCNRRAVAAINEGGGDRFLALRAGWVYVEPYPEFLR